MNKNFYKPRVIDKQVKEYLNTFGAICIEGPKWCGKTWTSSYHCNSEFYLADPAGNFQNRKLAEISPDTILEGATPRLIDEWQEYPPLWDAVRHKVDQTNQKGQFILTGSATPNHKGILHSGAGRIGKLRMRPMSLYESGNSSGQISLEALCSGQLTPVITGEVNLKNIIELIIRGGWPGSLDLPVKQAALLPLRPYKKHPAPQWDAGCTQCRRHHGRSFASSRLMRMRSNSAVLPSFFKEEWTTASWPVGKISCLSLTAYGNAGSYTHGFGKRLYRPSAETIGIWDIMPSARKMPAPFSHKSAFISGMPMLHGPLS